MPQLRLLFIFICLSVCARTAAQAQVEFIPNHGQWNKAVDFRSAVPGGFLFLHNNRVTYQFADHDSVHELHHQHAETGSVPMHAVQLQFVDAQPAPVHQPYVPSKHYYNYFLGNKESRWASKVPAYQEVWLQELYPGINLQVQALGDRVKLNYEVAAGVDPQQIRIRYQGAEDVYLQQGKLVVKHSLGQMVEQAPITWQVSELGRKEVPCELRLDGNVVSFHFPEGYNRSLPLLIDPTVVFATYSGSPADNFGFTATFDTAGYAYSGGTVYDFGFPTTPGAYQLTWAGGVRVDPGGETIARDIGILKYSPDGTTLEYATYLGGSWNEDPHSMIVNSRNELLVFGNSSSHDFPVTTFAYDTAHHGGTDIIVAKLSEDGSTLLASTFVGGSNIDGLNGKINASGTNVVALAVNYGDVYRGEVQVDEQDGVYFATSTWSHDFPVQTQIQDTFGGGQQDAVVVKLSPDLSQLEWSTYLGGTEDDAAYGLVTGPSGSVYATGGTRSPWFFSDTTAIDTAFAGGIADIWVAHIDSSGQALTNATYISTSKYEQAYFIQRDQQGDVYITGQTNSPDYPVLNTNYLDSNSGHFVTKLNGALDSIVYSTLFGKPNTQMVLSPGAFLVDYCGRIYFSGWGGQTNAWPAGPGGFLFGLPTTPGAFQPTTQDGSDFYVAVFAKNMDSLIYATFFGGPLSAEHVDGGTSRFDKGAIIYQSVCAGCGGFDDFPTTPNAWSEINPATRPGNPNLGGCNNALFKIDLESPALAAAFEAPQSGCGPFQVQFTNQTVNGVTYEWDFGDGTTSNDFSPSHLYSDTGHYMVTLVTENILSCNGTDTVRKEIYVYGEADAAFQHQQGECANIIDFKYTGSLGATYTWHFGDGNSATGAEVQHTFSDSGLFNVELIVDANTPCADTLTQPVNIATIPKAEFVAQVDSCTDTVRFVNTSTGATSYRWQFGDGSEAQVPQPVHQYAQVGQQYTVSLLVNEGLACEDSAVQTIDIPEPLKAGFDLSLNACTRTVTVENTSTAASRYTWSFGGGDTLVAFSPEHQYSAPGDYTITLVAKRTGGCTDTAEAGFTMPTLSKANFSVDLDSCTGLYRFYEKVNSNVEMRWYFGDGNISESDNPTHKYAVAGTYIVKLIVNPFTPCADTAEVRFQVDTKLHEELFIPNVFTPGEEDDQNRYFTIRGINPKCETLEFTVFNRWGQRIYDVEGTVPHWDGTWKKKELPEGTYFYLLRSSKLPGEELHGTIELIRDRR